MRAALTSLLLLTMLVGCSTQPGAQGKPNPREYQVAAYLWQQTSGEYRALVYQAYNIAREKMERDLEDKHNRKRAVVFDIDETILDNSFGGAKEIKEGIPWKETLFADWVKEKRAIAIPGALDFIKFLVDRQVEVFYISNRKLAMFDDTLINLQAQGFPVKKQNLMLMGDDSSKEPRRQEVLKKYDIVMLVGDNLTDFHQAFEKKNVTERNGVVDLMKADFGQKFIMLPNPLYGDWERALPRDKSRIELLKVTP